MTQREVALSLLHDGKGYLTAKVAGKNGINPVTLKRMEERGLIERLARGLYVSVDVIPDSFFLAQYRCPKGVFSHETALFFHGLSDRTPFLLMMTIPSGWNSRLLTSDDVLIFYGNPAFMNAGITEVVTPYGMTVAAYDVERTLCDCLRNIDKLDKDLVLTALKRYMKDSSANKVKLLEYAITFKIRDLVLRYMEVLS